MGETSKMKHLKIMSIFVVLVFAFSMLAACGSDPVADDLTSYVNDQMPAVQAKYNTALDAYNAVAGDNYTDDATMLASLTETVVPTIADALAAAQAIAPATPEVTALNAQYVTALMTYNDCYTVMQEALANGDATKMDEAAALLETATTQGVDFNDALDALAKDHGLTITTD